MHKKNFFLIAIWAIFLFFLIYEVAFAQGLGLSKGLGLGGEFTFEDTMSVYGNKLVSKLGEKGSFAIDYVEYDPKKEQLSFVGTIDTFDSTTKELVIFFKKNQVVDAERGVIVAAGTGIRVNISNADYNSATLLKGAEVTVTYTYKDNKKVILSVLTK